MSLQSVRGTHDFLPDVQGKHRLIIECARSLAERFGFHEMSTPVFESSDVFKRTLGEASDIVNKEMYTFKDRNGDELTLRPEGTAGMARAFISEGLSQNTPWKVFYHGPMFRYERPQKGRYRQFHQIGIELMGAASPLADVECLAVAYEILKAIQVQDTSQLEINSIGDEESRKAYVAALVHHLKQYESKLSPDSQKRLTTNPLRILDSKDENDRSLLQNAPVISDFLNEASNTFFTRVTTSLDELGIPYRLNPFLVRGLDYYTHTVFEFRTSSLGAQDAILSGGRYDRLLQQMGGPDTPSVGWAAGLERLALLSPLTPARSRPVAVIPVHGSVETQAFKLAYDLRARGLHCEIAYSGNLSKRMKKATNQNCWAAILVGPDELAAGQLTLKLLDSGEQQSVETDGIFNHLQSQLRKGTS
ncbi:MAG: histidine--tRNA ligase [Bdellovibrionales bacterium]